MKLIDVDNFLKQYSDQVCGDTIDAIDLRLALLKEPTVEAVPVEWLMKHIMIGNEFATIVIDEWRKENKNENIS